jgi:hypothetical protein
MLRDEESGGEQGPKVDRFRSAQFVSEPFGVIRDAVVQTRRQREQAHKMGLDRVG